MKYLLTLFLLCLTLTNSFSQTKMNSYSKFIEGYWGKWETSYTLMIQGTYDDFIIYNEMDHPSKYMIKVRIYNMVIDNNKKEKRRRRKENDWYRYNATVTFFTKDYSDDYEEFIDHWPYNYTAHSGEEQEESATILIAPYKNKPSTYNIIFDDNEHGLGIMF